MTTMTKANPISDRISNMKESATIAMAQAARDLASKGVNVINLSVGEPDFDTPDYIKDAAKKALDDGFTGYSPVPGYPALKQAIVDKLKRDNNIEATPDQIVVSTGAKQSIANIVLSLVNPGDEVIIIAPYWVSYNDIVDYAEGDVKIVSGSIDNGFKPTAAEIEAAITDKTKLIMFSSPSNPAGALFSQAELSDFADVLERNKHVFAMSDEIYEYINYVGGHTSLGSFTKVKDQVITINGFAKGYAMTGWRMGYICAPAWLAKATQKIQGQVTSGANSFSQMACVTALEDTENFKKSNKIMSEAFLRRRDLIISLLNEVPNVRTETPEGAFYVFPEVKAYFGKTAPDGTVIKGASELAIYLLNNANVSTVTGEAFGAPDNIRISYAASDENITEAIGRIKEWLAKLA